MRVQHGHTLRIVSTEQNNIWSRFASATRALYAVCENVTGIRLSTMAYALPRVVRLRRRGGKIVQSCNCYIGRAVKKGGWNLNASMWANPMKRRKGMPLGSTLKDYEQYVRRNPMLMHEIPLLAGKTLGCWCKPNPCHGDVLVKLFQEYLEEDEFEEIPDLDDEDDFMDKRLDFAERKENSQYNKPTSEGVIIGVTYTKRPNVCVMAISGGKLIRPLCRYDFVRSDSLCRVGTKFHFSIDEQEATPLPHVREDTFIEISGIDPKPIASVAVNNLISLCAQSQKASAQELLNALAVNRQTVTHTPFVNKGDDLPSSVFIKVESDVVMYQVDGRRPRAQFCAQGHELSLPVTSVGLIEKFFSNGKKNLTLTCDSVNFVRVCLARPYLPWLSSHQSVARCYAVFTGAVFCVDSEVIVM